MSQDPHDDSWEWLDDRAAERKEWKDQPSNPGWEHGLPLRPQRINAELVMCEGYVMIGEDPLSDDIDESAVIKSDTTMNRGDME